MGRSLLAGKIPYRDLFEQKGPVVYFVTAFACLFPNPNLVILLLEIICLSLFLFFAYRICLKRLNTFYALIALPILVLAIFTTQIRFGTAATTEEFCLPIHAYFLLCWLEFLLEKRDWTWVRSLCLGLCFGIMFWTKYTLLFFIVAPMLIWLILNLRKQNYRHIFSTLGFMLIGVMIVTLPMIIFYGINHACDNLFRIYFLVNLTAYSNNINFFDNWYQFFTIGTLVLILILWGVASFTIRHYHDSTGLYLLIAFIVSLGLLSFKIKGSYYFIELIPYAILGTVDLLEIISAKLTLKCFQKLIYIIIVIFCLAMCAPMHFTNQYIYNYNDAPRLIADVIQKYEIEHWRKTTLFCYKIGDLGFYNTTGKIPNDYYWVNNYLNEEYYPEMYASFHESITQQTSDFVITTLDIWKQENDFLSQYYGLYTDDVNTNNTYHSCQLYSNTYIKTDLVLLIKIDK